VAPPYEQTTRNQRTDSESWSVDPSLTPVNMRATIYSLLLIGALLMAAGVTLAMGSLTTTRTETKVREGEAGLFDEAATATIPGDVIKETVAALSNAKGPNLVVLAGVLALALAAGLAWNS